MNRKAFTLIELLVVIAIIAILAAILFPVFAQAKAAAKKTASLSNYKQVGTSTMLYNGDFDDMYPRGEYLPQDGRFDWATFTWREAIMPYVKNGVNTVTWMHPSGTPIPYAYNGIWKDPGEPEGRYGMSGHRALMPPHSDWQFGQAQLIPSRGPGNIERIAEVGLLFPVGINPDWQAGVHMETAWWWHGGAQWPPVFTGPTSGARWDNDRGPCTWGGDPLNPSCAMPRYRHNGVANVTFTDGHAKGVRKGTLNWCVNVGTPGFNERPAMANENYDWLWQPGNACEAFR